MNNKYFTIAQINKGLNEKKFSCLELTTASLKLIEKNNSRLNDFISLNKEGALAVAKEVDEFLSQGNKVSGLMGVPASLKDVLMSEGERATAGSKILENYQAVYDATAVRKLKDQQAVLLGKNNCDEFAMGASTEHSAFRPTHNPWDLKKVPGGSSGGSAAAVAAGEVVFSLGTDTGGSIRQPASFCGVVGLKPTYGLVSRYGLIAMASSLDCIGPFTRTVADAAEVLEVIAGPDPLDATTKPQGDFSASDFLAKNIKDLTIGVPKEFFVKGLDPQIEKTIKKYIGKLEAEGAKIVEVSLPHTTYALAVYYILVPAEVSSNLAKFDGLRYGGVKLDKTPENLLEYYQKVRGIGFGQEVRRRILLGTFVLSSGYVEQYYLQAQKVRTKIIEDFSQTFSQVDVLITPTTPSPAFSLGEKSSDPVSMYLSDIYTSAVNLAGLPAISLPIDKVEGMPVGMQIIADKWQENKMLHAAAWVEKLRGDFSYKEI